MGNIAHLLLVFCGIGGQRSCVQNNQFLPSTQNNKVNSNTLHSLVSSDQIHQSSIYMKI